MRVLLTGATGFIGGHLLPALLEDGHRVIALARDPHDLPPRDGLEVVAADLADGIERGRMPPAEAVVHLAQANVSLPAGARELVRVNVQGTHDLLELARESGAERFVFASSGSIYGLGERPVAEEDARRASDLYAVTKQAAELFVGAYRDSFSTAVLRPFAPYGPGQHSRVVPALIDRVREGRPVTLNSGGRPRMSPVYVSDVVRVILAALVTDGHHVVNVAGDEVVGIRELAERIGEALGREPVFERGREAAGDIVGLNARMHELYAPGSLVSLEAGLRETVHAEAVA